MVRHFPALYLTLFDYSWSSIFRSCISVTPFRFVPFVGFFQHDTISLIHFRDECLNLTRWPKLAVVFRFACLIIRSFSSLVHDCFCYVKCYFFIPPISEVLFFCVELDVKPLCTQCYNANYSIMLLQIWFVLQPWLDEWSVVPVAVLTTHKHWSV